MTTGFIWLNGPAEVHTCEEHSEDQSYTQQEFQTSSAHGGTAMKHQAARSSGDSSGDTICIIHLFYVKSNACFTHLALTLELYRVFFHQKETLTL